MFAFARNLVKSTIDARGSSSGAGNTPIYGFRVVHVDQNSPAAECGMESLFDFVIGINGHRLIGRPKEHYETDLITTEADSSEDPPTQVFLDEISRCSGTSASLTVWTAKGRVQREVVIPVSLAAPDSDDFGLGLSLHWTPLSVADHIWHVLNVSANSPAQQAGLISHSDYIVAAENGLLAAGGEGLLARVVSRMVATYYELEDDVNVTEKPNEPPSIELYVYNHDYDTLRPVRIHPNPDWGGSGLLGCGVGYGLLHRLPVVISNRRSASHHRSTSFAPGDTLFDSSSSSTGASAFIPANAAPLVSPPLISPPAGSGPPPLSSSASLTTAVPPRKKAHHHQKTNVDLSSYFEEEEKRNRENDIVRTSVNPSLPPPPKAS